MTRARALVLCSIVAIVTALVAGQMPAWAVSPDPPPGSTRPVTIVQRDYVCAFTMVKVGQDAGHVYWQAGARRWCKWVARP